VNVYNDLRHIAVTIPVAVAGFESSQRVIHPRICLAVTMRCTTPHGMACSRHGGGSESRSKLLEQGLYEKFLVKWGDGRACDVHFYSSSACFIKFEVRTIIGYSVNLEF
jgi:hypothetical protein